MINTDIIFHKDAGRGERQSDTLNGEGFGCSAALCLALLTILSGIATFHLIKKHVSSYSPSPRAPIHPHSPKLAVTSIPQRGVAYIFHPVLPFSAHLVGFGVGG